MSYTALPIAADTPSQFEPANILMLRPETARLEMGVSRLKRAIALVEVVGSAVVLVERSVSVRRKT